MAFTQETGEGVAGANAYISLAFVDSYHTDRGNSGWTGDNAVKQAAIIRASDYIDKRFGSRFRGYRQTKDQGLDWPRLNAVDDSGYLLDEVPDQLQKACAEYALRALSLTPLAPDPALSFTTRDTTGSGSSQSDTAQGGVLTSTKEKVGPIETEYKYQALSEDAMFKLPPFPEADMLLSGLLTSSMSGTIARG